MVKTPMRTETEQGKKGRSSPVALGKVNLLLAILALLVIAGAYWVGVLPAFLPEALALLILTLSLVTVASRAWHARRGGLEYGLLRHPFRRELRPYLLQCLNRWLFLALFGATILAGTFALVPAQVGSLFSLPLPERIPYQPLVIALGVGPLVMAALALVPGRRVQIATNVLVAIGTVFLAIHLVRIYTPPADPVAIDPPLAGEWETVSGGRSTLVSHHYSAPFVRDALDFVQLDEEGRGYQGDPKRAESWYGFGEPVLAPADGTVVSVSDVHPDEPIGKTRADALLWQPHPPPDRRASLRGAGAPQARKRAGERGRSRAAGAADRRGWRLGRLAVATSAHPRPGRPRLRSSGSHHSGRDRRRSPHQERKRVEASGGGPQARRPDPPDRGLTSRVPTPGSFA